MLQHLLLAALGLVAPALDAGPPSPPAAVPQDSPESQDTRALRRILHLNGGGSLRAVTRFDGRCWEWRQGDTWCPLPAGAVTHVSLEKEAVARFKTELAAAFRDPDPVGARAAAIESGFAAGLLEEAVTAAEVVLRDYPRHAPTLAVLRRRAGLLGVPEVTRAADGALDLEAVFRASSNRSRVLREAAVLRLEEATASDTDRDALRTACAAQLQHVLPGRRSFAALVHARLFAGEDVRPMLVHALRDASEEVRAEAARAVGAAGDPGLVLPFVKVLERSSSPTLRRHAAEALGHAGYRSAVAPLVGRLAALATTAGAAGGSGSRPPHGHIFVGRQFAYIQDFDVEVAQLQSVADPQVNVLIGGAVLDAGVIGSLEYRTAVTAERAAVQRALEGVTGLRPGGRAKDWLQWWEREGRAAYE